MEHNMILSASGWRKVFAVSGDEQDKNPEISNNDKALAIAAANVFFDYLKNITNQESPVIALGRDSRPTGKEICQAMIPALIKKGAIVQYTDLCSAPEIMAYARKLDGFIYISASHNPIGHNGIKFGTNDGGVLNAQENAKVVEAFLSLISDDKKLEEEVKNTCEISKASVKNVYESSQSSKHNALKAYEDFIRLSISDISNKEEQNDFFENLKSACQEQNIAVLCDFNGSSRAKCIDKKFFTENGINFYSINQDEIVHEIIPEAENLVHVAKEMERLQKEGHKEVLLAYMPDCDGDRGNIVYWDSKNSKAEILKAQEVFSLSVLAELSYSIWKNVGVKNFHPAVCVNGPTSMRIEKIANCLGAEVFRSEVGEANVVNLAREKREENYNVRILGEGSNGGTITYPSSVRDPLNTVFAIIKLLVLKQRGLYELWCNASGTEYSEDFTLRDILESLPVFTTTGVSEQRAILKINTKDHSKLKAKFQKAFEKEWKNKSKELKEKYNIHTYEAVITNGTKETRNVQDYSLSNKGGLKILFKDDKNNNKAFIWMRGSGTEPVFRVMCDVEGNNAEEEKHLLQWETELLQIADKEK